MIYPIVTRFNPTANGPLHLGHLMMCLINEHEAHSHGGRFLVRLDDNQSYWTWKLGDQRITEYCMLIQKDIEWSGIRVDAWSYQSAREIEVESLGESLGGQEGRLSFFHATSPETPFMDTVTYPYAPALTAEKVLLDFMDEVTVLIRGEDLITEYSLYCYFCELWGIPNPKHYYLPRLRLAGGKDMQHGISKTLGNYQINTYRARGWSPKDVLDNLAESCLEDPKGGWYVDNLLTHPVLVKNLLEP